MRCDEMRCDDWWLMTDKQRSSLCPSLPSASLLLCPFPSKPSLCLFPQLSLTPGSVRPPSARLVNHTSISVLLSVVTVLLLGTYLLRNYYSVQLELCIKYTVRSNESSVSRQ